MKNYHRIACLFCLLLLSCSTGKKAADEESISALLPDEVTEVRAIRLEYSDFHHELIAHGAISARHKADLRFQTSEVIAAIFVKNGDKVTKGQQLAMLDPFKLQNTLLQAADNLERARLELQDVLIGQGYSLNDSLNIPPEILQIAKVKSNYDQSANQYALAEYNLQHSTLHAPFDGVVANLFSKTYNLPDASLPFCTIIDVSHPEVDFKVLESELPFLQKGDKITVFPFSLSDYAAEGQVAAINPVVDKNGMVILKAQVNNPAGKLYDGMNVKIHLQRSLGRQLVIPKEALVLRSNKKVVFTLKNGLAQWVYVETGSENATGYVVTDGLAVGDSVIYEGNINLAHESPVQLKD
jgi:RND family efflux transporter MFP subunit